MVEDFQLETKHGNCGIEKRFATLNLEFKVRH
jgi:hypothetical protein